jgi:hypothetical protein
VKRTVMELGVTSWVWITRISRWLTVESASSGLLPPPNVHHCLTTLAVKNILFPIEDSRETVNDKRFSVRWLFHCGLRHCTSGVQNAMLASDDFRSISL